MSAEPAGRAADFQRLFFEQLLASQFWPAEKLADYQRAQLEPFLLHARRHVPLYENRLDPLFRPDGSIDWTRWPEVPVLKRSALVENWPASIARVIPGAHGPTGEARTSGTTGVPLRVVFTALTGRITHATRWRSDIWQGLDWSQTIYVRHGEDRAADWPDGVAAGPWGPPWSEAARNGRSFRLNRQVPPERQLEFIGRIGARYAAPLGPKTAHVLADESRRRGLGLTLEAILVNGEAVEETDRIACRRAFGARIIDVYSSKEGHHMAHRCPRGSWHVNAEATLVEILDEEDRPVAPGETGRVVVTPFWNYAQPLIRYEQGDLAVAGAPCPCGRGLPTIAAISGRVSHMFRHPDGRTVSLVMPERYRQVLGAARWQFAQVGPNDYEIRYVPREGHEAGDEGAVAAGFRQWFFADANVRFRRMAEIPPLPSGKHIEYVNEYTPPSRTEPG